jgi:phosphinothricin acetyltransferase
MSRNLLIRHATASDVTAITSIYNEAILTTTATFDIEPKTIEDRAQWLAEHGERFPVLVAEADGEVLGWTSLTRWSARAGYDDTAETALYVHSAHRGCGVGRRLKAAMIEEARRLKFHTLIVRVTEDSEVSLHLNKTAGFVMVGTIRQAGRKFGRLLDVHILQKMLD